MRNKLILVALVIVGCLILKAQTSNVTGWNTAATTATTIPSGLLTFVVSGACPTGWSQVTALNGKVLRGTVSANADVGATGGSDTYTPAGTNAASATTGNCATAVKVGTSGSNACATVAPNLTVPAQAFTGTQATVIPAYVKVIFCSKD